MTMTDEKKPIIICTCSPGCPGFEKIDFVELGNRIQTELPKAKYAALFVQICEEPGLTFLKEYLNKNQTYVFSACKETRFKKLIKEALDEAEIEDSQIKVVNPAGISTDEAFNMIKEALEG